MANHGGSQQSQYSRSCTALNERAEPAVTAQRLDRVRFEFQVASSAWLTRDRSAKVMIMLATLIFAEVADKMNSWPAVVAWVVLISAASVITIRRRSWLAVIPCLLAIFWALVGYGILSDRFIRPAVIAELGLSYILIEFLPLIVSVAFGVIEMKKRPNQSLQRNASTRSVSNFESPTRRG
jgi:hypothetical protein